jgi:hypothetical protein
MFRYQFHLLDDRGAVAFEHAGLFAHDAAAIDHAGWLDHPLALRIWRSGRLVAEFPPVAPRPAGRFGDRGVSAGDLKLLRATMVTLGLELGLDAAVTRPCR